MTTITNCVELFLDCVYATHALELWMRKFKMNWPHSLNFLLFLFEIERHKQIKHSDTLKGASFVSIVK